jgi:hypothetical protein
MREEFVCVGRQVRAHNNDGRRPKSRRPPHEGDNTRDDASKYDGYDAQVTETAAQG